MKDDSLSDVDQRYQKLFQIGVTPELLGVKPDPWIVGKDDYWFMIGDKRLHRESWNAAIDAVAEELTKVYPYSAKEVRTVREQMK